MIKCVDKFIEATNRTKDRIGYKMISYRNIVHVFRTFRVKIVNDIVITSTVARVYTGGKESVSKTTTSNIYIGYWTIPTIGKHIMADNSLAGRCQCVRVYEAAGSGIVVAGQEIIEPGIVVVTVATTA